MDAKKIIAGFATAAALGGVVVVGDVATASIVVTLNDPITLNEVIKFGAPSHTVEVSDNGLIDLVVGEKHYGLTPSKAADKNKTLFLNIEQSEEVKIKDVFGTGSEIILKNTPRSFSKVVSLTEDFIKDIPADAKYVEVSFDLTGWNVPDGTYTERVELQQDVWIEKALVWDSSGGDPNQNYMDVELVISEGTLIKRIPVEWLNTSVFPIYTDATFSFGTKENVDAGSIGFGQVVKTATDEFVICWNDVADATQEGDCVAASVVGTDITFGTQVNFASDVFALSAQGGPAVCSVGNNRFAVVYSNDADTTDGYIRIGTTTGTTINTFGTNTQFLNSDINYMSCTQVDTDTFVVGFGDSTNDDVSVTACSIASGTPSCGTIVDLQAGSSVSASLYRDTACATLDTNKFVCRYVNIETGFIYVRAGTVSGTTITLGTEATVSNTTGTLAAANENIIALDTDKFVSLHAATSTLFGEIVVGTVSGTTITLGATTTITATSTNRASIRKLDTDSYYVIQQYGLADETTTYLAVTACDVDFITRTSSCSSTEQFDPSTDAGGVLSSVLLSACKLVIAWEDDNDTNDLFAIVGDTLCNFFDDTSFDLLDE